ncbi:MAG: endolytic transglycosylase MltG [Patescibacteria group bacterium]|nr:endolytic transglycosylase MltG [Patescibacteria group bacterium]
MKRILIFCIILVVILVAGLFWWNNGLSPTNKSNKSQVIFVVNKGEGVREISNNLKDKKLIRDPVVFFILIKKLGIEKNIQAGDFRLSPSMSAEEVAENLTHGSLDVWVTIPEGKRAEEIAEILQSNLVTYKPTWKKILIDNEGYLFPDTYLIPKDADINLIISMFKNNFETKYESITPQNKIKLSKNKIITIASLIEREAKYPEDRPLIASVIMNRLELGMPLQIDATIQYILGYQLDEKSWWKKSLTIEDLKLDSPYNTYINVGLPPGPISNPGLDSIKAVINPASTDYFYYLSDKSGHNHYAKTISEHNANIQKYGL